LIDTPPKIQALVSRMKSWFGSGGITKSVGCSAFFTTDAILSGSSLAVTPPTRRVASSSPDISPIQSARSPENITVASSGRRRRVRIHSRASG
jgi:hypothetical protein